MEVAPYRRTIIAATGVAGSIAIFTGTSLSAIRYIVHFGTILIPATHNVVHSATTAAWEAASIISQNWRPEAEFVASTSALATTRNHAPESWIQAWLHLFIHWLQVSDWIRTSRVILWFMSFLAYPGLVGRLRVMLEYLATAWILIFAATSSSRALWRIPKGIWHVFFPSITPKERHPADPLESIARSLKIIARSYPANDVCPPLYRFLTHLTEPLNYAYTLFLVGYNLAAWAPQLVTLFGSAILHIIKFAVLVVLLGVAYALKKLVSAPAESTTTLPTTNKENQPESTPSDQVSKQDPKQAYNLQDLDFSTRPALLASLAPQIRIRSFNGPLLHSALATAGRKANWPLIKSFEAAAPRFAKFHSDCTFFDWFLKWNVTREAYDELVDAQKQQGLALTTPVTAYYDVLNTLRQLDCLPYLQPSFQEVFDTLVGYGALSDPSVAQVLQTLYKTNSNYYVFFKQLDKDFWRLFQKLPGHPSAPPVKRHFLRSARSKRSPPRSSVSAAVVSPTKSADFSNYSSVSIHPVNHRSTAYWDQGSADSFISPSLVKDLQLSPKSTGRPIHLRAFGAAPTSFLESVVSIEFPLPGSDATFKHTFVVFDS